MTDLAKHQQQLLAQLAVQLTLLQQRIQQYQGNEETAIQALDQLAIFQSALTLADYGQQVAANVMQLELYVTRGQLAQVDYLAEQITQQMSQLWRRLAPLETFSPTMLTANLDTLLLQRQQYQYYYQRLNQQLQQVADQLNQCQQAQQRLALQQQYQQWQQRLQRCQLALDNVNQQLAQEQGR